MRRFRVVVGATLAVLAVSLSATATAVAKEPAGKYKCQQERETLKLTNGGKYKYDGGSGNYKYSSKSMKITFKGGPLRGFFAFRVPSGAGSGVDLFNKKGKFVDNCFG